MASEHVERVDLYRSRWSSGGAAVRRAHIRATGARRGARAEAGQALVWAAVMMPLFLSIVGLAIDGGIVFDARRELQTVADSAARAGAMQIDPGAYRDSSGAALVLDREAARRVAAEYLAARAPGRRRGSRSSHRRVVVEVHREVPTGFLRLVGYRSVRVTAVAPAEVRVGVERPGP